MRHLLIAAVCLLMVGAVLLAVCHLSSADRAAGYRMDEPKAAKRRSETMDYAWPDGRINPNDPTADLTLLKGVGVVIANRIRTEAAENGAFAYPPDLLSVSGISKDKLSGFWDQLFLPHP